MKLDRKSEINKVIVVHHVFCVICGEPKCQFSIGCNVKCENKTLHLITRLYMEGLRLEENIMVRHFCYLAAEVYTDACIFEQ